VQRRKHYGHGARRVPTGVLLLGQLAALAIAATAGGQERRVALLNADPPIARALTVALSPWQLGVVPASALAPIGDLETASAGARVIATDQNADVVVWIAPAQRAGERGSLWVYDTANQQLVVRRLIVSPPFDAAAAAAVALSVKTILRSSPLVSQFTQAASDDTSAPSAPSATARPATVEPPPSIPVAPAPVEAPAAPSEPEAPHTSWRFETLIGARTPTGSSAAAEPCAELGLSLWPREQNGHLGWGIDVKGGTGLTLSSDTFQGEYRQGAIDATARLRAAAARWLSFELRGGPELIVTSFSGQPVSGPSIQTLRANPALDFGGVVDFTPWARVNLGLVGDATALLRFQRYSVAGVRVIDEPPVSVALGLRLSVEVD
jgi:hypothetical protein